jgi:hypothetical protein
VWNGDFFALAANNDTTKYKVAFEYIRNNGDLHKLLRKELGVKAVSKKEKHKKSE